MVCFIANGQEEKFTEVLTIADYLETKGLKADQAIVAVNSDIISVEAYASSTINDGDSLDVMSFVGGG